MSTPPKFYVNHMFETTSYRANWTPDLPVVPGDIGVLEYGQFVLTSSLAKQGLPFEVRESTGSLNLDYNSQNTAVRTINANSGIIPVSGVPVQANVEVTFKKDVGVLFQFSGSKRTIISNLDELGDTILERYNNGVWKKEWVIITDVITTDNTYIIISTTADNTLQLACSLPLGGDNNLALPGIKVGVVNESGSSIKLLGSNHLTPLYNVRGVQKPFLGNPVFRLSEAIRNPDFKALEELPFDAKELVTE
ncbi:hypothetical protein CLV51_104101 [Chitinophaga niastensis]|uniref:Uncharacterized protein n=1 Tax=Chitinophaga niastensis TaxID=536980 RepID=A0A2P8HGR8_CHINA|nr:hypothetical protein [Chitinophaga niastensis]PSL45399.1 hypothetical protein CLV51_104101 [Chitinophaga niastensis]